ncbi:hypothetical protein [Pseudooceanicola sp.]|uniref:hypothetical protein n=1 Tax=Pseudooceanicola sp. TaxID=1914328 RepID=UPI002602D8E7|nr:hypothetical protein [Pseudooceanicola sp.]MDF1854466.1 hypothetical protein [Pseudooceanicola sp.]
MTLSKLSQVIASSNRQTAKSLEKPLPAAPRICPSNAGNGILDASSVGDIYVKA